MAVRLPPVSLRFLVFALLVTAGYVSFSCSNSESPTSPGARPSGNRATISGTLVAAADPSKGAGEPMANVTVSVAGTGMTAQTGATGNFTLTDVPAGVVSLDFRGAGLHTSATVSAPAGLVTKVTVTVNREHSTVSLTPRSDGTEGTVDSISSTSFVLKSSHGMVMVQTDANTKFRMHGSAASFGDLKVGQHVEVAGSPQADGSILASQVNIEIPEQDEATRTPTSTGTITPAPTRTPRPDKVELEGTVATINGTSFDITTRSGLVTIQTDSTTRFQKEDGSGSLADLKVGDKVEVEGARQSDNSVLASRVNFENNDQEDRTKTPKPTATMAATATPAA